MILMKNLNHIYTTVLVAIIVGITSCSPRRSEPIRGELTIKDQRVENGRKIYMAHCQKCHPNGEGGLGPALNSNPAPTFVKLFQVRHGLGVMPSFKRDEIESRELKDLGKYMKALKHNR